MSEIPGLDTKLYAATPDRKLSLKDMLDYFSRAWQLARLRPPPEGRLPARLPRGRQPDEDEGRGRSNAATMRALARAILSEEDWESLEHKHSVDSSYMTETMQFRLNCFPRE